ncbi:hypothetical protein [Erwinia mallotivora]|uniref:hypothetical protein n=1 Tax=Erwinia mallotivora TaxID=69222 RepID=UPI0021BEC971|nr:hypothetical protein [Erwinia mallotivora]
MNVWLVSYQEECGGSSHDCHMLLRGADLPLAEAACDRMGRAWWYPERPVSVQGCYWQFSRGAVWLNVIVQLTGQQEKTLSGLGFLDCWQVTGTPDMPVISDRHGNCWEAHR